ncbi:MAG: glutamate-1-semialdehyde 2,1-aminomutase [Chloroflexi bacterium]|nr:glutamate-1-semialdehyde 2,1-aminomutase [Chloroflexota bacterium]
MSTRRSQQLFARAQEFFPGGVNSPVRAWHSVGGEPVFIARGAGAKIVDVDGNEYLDYVGSWGPLILGHSHPRVVAAIQAAAMRGASYGAPCEPEIELAQRITGAFPSMERMRFVSSGTEATMSALRLARAFTRRSKVLKFAGGYHGHADFLLARAGSGIATLALSDSAGVPSDIAATTLVVPYNNLQAVEQAFHVRPEEIAAIVVEPVAGNMGVVPPAPGFLQGLVATAHHHGALAIFDEVITGFRVGWGGAQGLFGIAPDLTCLGKIVGGGLPVGAYGGRREIMDLVAPSGPVYQAGTLSGNPLAMAAGIATLDAIADTPNAYAELERRSALLEQGLRDAARQVAIPVSVNRVGSMLTLFFNRGTVADYDSATQSDTDLFARYFRAMLTNRVYLPPSQFEAAFVSLAHSDQDIADTIDGAQTAFQGLRAS